VKACYRVRSEIIHGRWEDDPDFDDHMYNTEAIVRTVVRHIADKPGMLGAFLSPKRDEFPDCTIFQSRLAGMTICVNPSPTLVRKSLSSPFVNGACSFVEIGVE